jgi:hypothetical protein
MIPFLGRTVIGCILIKTTKQKYLPLYKACPLSRFSLLLPCFSKLPNIESRKHATSLIPTWISFVSVLFNFLISLRQFLFQRSARILANDGFTKPGTNFFKFISHATTRRRNETPDLNVSSLRRRMRPILFFDLFRG